MFTRLRALLWSVDAVPAERNLHLAAAALLVEAARMDGRVEAVERRRIVEVLAHYFHLPGEQAQSLLDQAIPVAERSVQLAGFARTLKDGMDSEARVGLIEMLWEVVYADGRVDDYEANLVRRLAGLLHVPDQDAGAARKRVKARLGIE